MDHYRSLKFDPAGAAWIALAALLIMYTVTADARELDSGVTVQHAAVISPP